MKEWRFLLAVVLLIASFVVHADALEAGFVYDDHRFIEFNPALRNVDIGSYFSDPVTASNPEGIQPDIYRPLRTTLFAFEYQMFGIDPHGWHTVSLLLHALNTALCFLLLAALFGTLLPAVVGAFVFAVHPVTSESVAWVSSQGDLLAMTFGLLALLCCLRRGWTWTALTWLSFAAAILAKESALVLPALVVLVACVRPPRTDGAPPAGSLLRRPGGETWLRVAGMAVGLGIYFVVRQNVLGGTLAQVPHPDGSVWASLRAMLDGFVTYVVGLLVPMGFNFDTHVVVPARFSDPRVILGLGMLLTIVFAGCWALRTRRWMIAFACLGFLVTLVPVSNVIVPLKTFVADRFLYPGLLCVGAGAGVLAFVSVRALSQQGWRFGLGVVGALAVAVACIAYLPIVSERNRAWADDVALWTAVRADRPSNPNAYYGLAFDHARASRLSEAERAFRTYIEFNPLDGKALVQLGDVFGEVARTLAEAQANQGASAAAQSNVEENRQAALVTQLRSYRQAFDVWRIHGLVRGRGSPALRNHVLSRWVQAAVELGDLGEARRANDFRFQVAGLDPRDPAQVAKAPWRLRLHRAFLALSALERPLESLSERQRARAEADRAAVLRDLGLDPRRANDVLLPQWERAMARLFDEAADKKIAIPVDAYVHRARALETMGRRGAAIRVLEDAERAYPLHPVIQRALPMLRGAPQ